MATGSGAACAEASDTSWFVHGGAGDRGVKVAALGLMRDFHRFGSTTASPWSVYGEAVVGQWLVHDRNADARSNYTQVGVAPVFRYTVRGGPFIEAGVGLALVMPRFHDGDRRFSTKFNFADHLGAGLRFGASGESEVSVRVEHFSNGGIRNPNPGQNFLELRYARRL